jgi:hypothetical protein
MVHMQLPVAVAQTPEPDILTAAEMPSHPEPSTKTVSKADLTRAC